MSAGGAYGEMIKRAGLGDAVRGLAGSHTINFVGQVGPYLNENITYDITVE